MDCSTVYADANLDRKASPDYMRALYAARNSVSSSLLGGYGEPKIILFTKLLIRPVVIDTAQRFVPKNHGKIGT